MADKQSAEKQALLRAYGAEVVLCPTNVAPESPESYYSVAARLARDIPGAFKPDQYWNEQNPAAHEATTCPEIWARSSCVYAGTEALKQRASAKNTPLFTSHPRLADKAPCYEC
jgi:cysteine synthase